MRSGLTIVGVAVAVVAVSALLSLADNLQQSSLSVYADRGIDVVVFRAGVTERLSSNLPQGASRYLAALPAVAAVVPSLSDTVLLHGQGVTGLPLHGWPADSPLFASLSMVQGRQLQESDTQGVVLGEVLSRTLARTAGDQVELEGVPLRVVGVFRSRHVAENAAAVVLLTTLQTMMDRELQVTEFQIQLDRSAAAAAQIAGQAGFVDQFCRQVEALRDDHGQRLGWAALPTSEFVDSNVRLRLAQALAWMTMLLALVMGTLGMMNTMLMAVLERTPELGVLRALGWRRGRLLRLVLGESLLLSLAGTGAGLLLACLLLTALSWWPPVQTQLDPRLTATAVTTAAALAALLGLCGGLYPAWRAAGLSPSETIHHD